MEYIDLVTFQPGVRAVRRRLEQSVGASVADLAWSASRRRHFVSAPLMPRWHVKYFACLSWLRLLL